MRVGRAAQAAIPSFDAGDGRSIFLFGPFVLPKGIRTGRIPEKTGPRAQRPRRATAWGRRRAGCGQLAARRSVAIPLSRCTGGSGLRAVNRSRYLSVPGPKGCAASFPTSGGKRVVRNDSSLRPGPCSLRGNESLGFSRLCCGASGGDPSALKGPGKIFVVSSEPFWRCRRFAALRLRRIVFRSEIRAVSASGGRHPICLRPDRRDAPIGYARFACGPSRLKTAQERTRNSFFKPGAEPNAGSVSARGGKRTRKKQPFH